MTRARLGALLVVIAGAVVAAPIAHAIVSPAPGPYDTASLVIEVSEVAFERLLSVPEVVSLARAGGAGLLAGTTFSADPAPNESDPPTRIGYVAVGGSDLAIVGDRVRALVDGFPTQELLVIVVGSGRSAEMIAAKDETYPIVLAIGPPEELLSGNGALGSLTSDSTHRDGVVVGADVGATVADFLGGGLLVSIDTTGSPGSPIEILPGPPPFALRERYLEQRRLSVPIGTAAALYVTGVGMLASALVALGRRRTEVRLRRIAGWTCLSVPALATALLSAGHLPDLQYANVVPFLALVTVFGTLAFSPLERQELTLVPAGIGLAILTFFVIEWLLGWTGMLTPLLGGSQLDGGRFYGLPNVAVGLLIGASLWVAQRLSTWRGFALICGVALFAGLPLVGSNLGGGVSLFATAGLWLAVRERERLGVWKGLGAFVGVSVVGTGLILLAHAISPVATHVTRFESTVDGPGGIVRKFLDRLQVGFDLIARNPAAIVPIVVLAASLVLILRPPAVIRWTFERWPAWRDAVLVAFLGGIVAYVVNDSGPSAASLASALGFGGMLGVSLLALHGKMDGDGER